MSIVFKSIVLNICFYQDYIAITKIFKRFRDMREFLKFSYLINLVEKEEICVKDKT